MVATAERPPVVIRGPMADRLYLPIKEKRWADIPKELCFWGGAGTGKSFSLMLILVLLMTDDEIGGLRILWCRKTRKSITNSSIVTYRKVLNLLGMTMSTKPTPAQRQSEVFHTNAGVNELVWMTLEDPENAFSAEYDIVVFEEAIQTSEATYETAAGRCLRNFAIDAQFVVSLTNPGSRFGWIYKRMSGPNARMVSCRTTIYDNPAYYDIEAGELTFLGQQYLDSLGHMYTGTRRERLLKGKWVSEEGWVLEELWNDDIHTFAGEFTTRPGKCPVLTIGKDHPTLPDEIEVVWTFGSLDHGFRNAGALLVWAVDRDGRLYLIDEVYHSGKDRDWWTEQIIDKTELYQLEVVVADHDPERQVHWNRTIAERLPARATTVDGEPFVRKCAKSRGDKDALKVDVVRTLLQDGPDGLPRCFLRRNARRHLPDPALKDEKPTCLEEEIPQLVWKDLSASQVDTREPEEKINEARANHAFDAWVYAGRFLALTEGDEHDWSRQGGQHIPGSFEAHQEAVRLQLEEEGLTYG